MNIFLFNLFLSFFNSIKINLWNQSGCWWWHLMIDQSIVDDRCWLVDACFDSNAVFRAEIHNTTSKNALLWRVYLLLEFLSYRFLSLLAVWLSRLWCITVPFRARIFLINTQFWKLKINRKKWNSSLFGQYTFLC